MEEYCNAGEELFILAIDIRKALDTVDIQCLRDVLLKLQVPSRLVDRVLLCVKDEVTRVLWENQLSEEVKRGKGIKQGCPLSPLLFNLLMQDVLRKTVSEILKLKLMDIGCLLLPLVLAFADDLLLIAKSKADLERILEVLEEQLEKVGLKINWDKSQVLKRYPNDKVRPQEIVLNRMVYKVEVSIKYLGVCLTSTLNRKLTNRQRCRNTLKTARLVVEFCKNYKPKWELGKSIYKTVLAPSLQCGTKGAAQTKASRIALANYEKYILRSIFLNC